MILNVDFKDEQEVIEVRAAMRSIVRKAVFNTLVYEGFKKDVEVSVTFVDNEGIKVLNRKTAPQMFFLSRYLMILQK